LVFCDTLAANYPKVIDYYLRGGKERLQADVGQRAWRDDCAGCQRVLTRAV
jgi:hypothetical protein